MPNLQPPRGSCVRVPYSVSLMVGQEDPTCPFSGSDPPPRLFPLLFHLKGFLACGAPLSIPLETFILPRASFVVFLPFRRFFFSLGHKPAEIAHSCVQPAYVVFPRVPTLRMNFFNLPFFGQAPVDCIFDFDWGLHPSGIGPEFQSV